MAVRIAFVRNTARNILKSSKNEDMPISVLAIAHKLNLKIFEYPDFPDSVSALVDPKKKIILVNPKHNDKRKRFSIAHEIGHYILDHFREEDDGVNIDDQIFMEYLKIKHSAEKETEANEFAAELLMPLDMVKKKLQIEYKKPNEMAEEFNVSEDAMWIRLSQLKLIKYL